MTGLRLKHLAFAAATACAVTLSGCGGIDGFEMNGKVFDMLGISPSAQDERKNEPKLADRPPLVMPPDTKRLPQPGTGEPPTDLAVNDADQMKAAKAKERDRLHMAYCKGEIQWKERALDPLKSGANRSPYGPCPTLAPSFTGSIMKN